MTQDIWLRADAVTLYQNGSCYNFGKFPWVTHGKELHYHSHGLLMGKNCVFYSWDRITCFRLNVKCSKVGNFVIPWVLYHHINSAQGLVWVWGRD